MRPKTKIIYGPTGRAGEYAGLAANLSRGCGHGCTYCYAPGVLRMNREEFNSGATARNNVLQDLKKDCEKLREVALDCPPILFSFSTDPYAPDENGLMREAIQIVKAAGLSLEILTKSGLKATRDFSLLTSGDAVAASLTLWDQAASERWETNASLPVDRILMLKEAKRRGLTTWASLEPVIDPAQTFKLIRQAAPYVDLFKVGKMNHAKTEIDWGRFASYVIRLFLELRKSFHIKSDLQKYVYRWLELKKHPLCLTREQVQEAALDRHRAWSENRRGNDEKEA